MKHFIILLMIVLLNNNTCTSQTAEQFRIGKSEHGKFTITENLDKVKAVWNAVMKTQNNTQQLTQFSVVSGIDSETRETYYLITGKNAANTFTIANEVYLNDNEFYFKNNDVSGTVSCSGCNYGCHVEKVRKKWYCSSECGGNCTKAETISY